MIIPEKRIRKFLPEKFQITDWDSLKPFFEDILSRNPDSIDSLERWLLDRSELESVIAEDAGWRYIRMTCDTALARMGSLSSTGGK